MLDIVLKIHNTAGFQVKRIHADREFKPLKQILHQDPDVDTEVILAPANSHVPEAERNNRTIKERNRATLA